MVKAKTVWVGAAVAMLLAVACKEPLDVGAFSVAGQWKGRLAVPVGTDSARYDFALDLDQNESDVSGSATIASGADTVDTNVSGTWKYPNVNLRFTAPGFDALNYAATFSTSDTLRGPVSGSGFSTGTLTIIRQP